jgi:hypothetical protein
MDILLPTLSLISSTSLRAVRGVLSMRRAALAASAASALALGALQPALATNGVVDINQARALAGGVTAGDTPGFPIIISESGSYRLTSNIDITGVASPLTTRAIEITAPDVSLDLNGFSVIGPVNCTGAGATISCLPALLVNAADLIYAGSSASRLSLRNGSVRGAAASGIYLDGPDPSIRDLVSSSNFAEGVRFNGTGTADNVRVIKNGFRGLSVGAEAALSRIYAKDNFSDGVRCATLTSRAYQVHAVSNGSLGVRNCAIESSHFVGNNGALANPQQSGIDVGNNVCYHSAVLTACP